MEDYEKRFVVSTIILLFLLVMDAILTEIGIRKFGIEMELNPTYVWLYNHGYFLIIWCLHLLKIFLVVFMIWFLFRFSAKDKKIRKRIFNICSGMMILTIIFYFLFSFLGWTLSIIFL